jgi:hypothetical protein
VPRGGIQDGRECRDRRSKANGAAHSGQVQYTALLAGMFRLPCVLPFRSFWRVALRLAVVIREAGPFRSYSHFGELLLDLQM